VLGRRDVDPLFFKRQRGLKKRRGVPAQELTRENLTLGYPSLILKKKGWGCESGGDDLICQIRLPRGRAYQGKNKESSCGGERVSSFRRQSSVEQGGNITWAVKEAGGGRSKIKPKVLGPPSAPRGVRIRRGGIGGGSQEEGTIAKPIFSEKKACVEGSVKGSTQRFSGEDGVNLRLGKDQTGLAGQSDGAVGN